MEKERLNNLSLKRERGSRMILDYVFMLTWDEFKQSHEINYETSRDLVQGILRQSVKRCSDDTLKHQLLLLMCRLSDGVDYNYKYNPNMDNTMLEEALIIFTHILDYFPALKAEGACIIRQMKVQAVFVCCRQNDFTLAKEVSNRLWKDSSVLDKISHKLVKNVLDSEDDHCSQLEDHSFESFLSQIVAFLGKITETFTRPFIDEVADEYNTYLDGVRKKKKMHNEDRLFKSSMIASVAEFLGVDDGKVVTKAEMESLDKKKQLIHDKVMREEVGHQTAFITAARRSQEGQNSNRELHTVKRRTKSLQTGSPHDETLSDASDEDNVNPDVPLHLRMHKSLSTASNLIRKQRIPWTEAEENSLILGVKKFGKGNWAQILEQYEFRSRTTVNLKDKWRNMEKTQT